VERGENVVNVEVDNVEHGEKGDNVDEGVVGEDLEKFGDPFEDNINDDVFGGVDIDVGVNEPATQEAQNSQGEHPDPEQPTQTE